MQDLRLTSHIALQEQRALLAQEEPSAEVRYDVPETPTTTGLRPVIARALLTIGHRMRRKNAVKSLEQQSPTPATQ